LRQYERLRLLSAKITVDSIAWCAGAAQIGLIYGFTSGLVLVAVAAAVCQAIIGLRLELYKGRWRYGAYDEVGALGIVVACGAVAATLMNIAVGRSVPAPAILAAAAVALICMLAARYFHRRVPRSRASANSETPQTRVLVIGAGWGGEQSVEAMLRDEHSPYLPVALLDDNPRVAHRRLDGVPVVGTLADLSGAVARYAIDMVLIAIPSADGELIRRIAKTALQLGVDVRVLPPVAELFARPVVVDDIRPVVEADLLGRKEINTDIESIANYLTGKRVLVTGAGGSIGSELCRQLWRLGVEELIMLDRDESALHAVQLSLEGRALLDSKNIVLCDLRDSARVWDVLSEHRPHVVFHAAALKHLPLLEMHPGEAVKTNIWGTVHLLEAACAIGVERLVNISTDKAADPISVLGYSKRITERLTAGVAANASGTYLSVRFGNVLGSRGSVLTTFRAQVAAGGPLTVTDPDVTRFFMTVEEAVQLVIQAGAIGRRGEALVLDMGSPVRIAEVARHLAAAAERPIEIVYTGLRHGEKLHEVLFGQDELDVRPLHPFISHVPVPPLGVEDVKALDGLRRNEEIISAMSHVAAGFASADIELDLRDDRSELDLRDDRSAPQTAEHV
jgi:FlaA1/EpsC-like NDP-sugar epimerase